MGFSLPWLLLLLSMSSRACVGFSSCGLRAQQLQAPGFRAQTLWLWLMGLVALQHVGSSQTRDWTIVSTLEGRFSATGPSGKSMFTLSNSLSLYFLPLSSLCFLLAYFVVSFSSFLNWEFNSFFIFVVNNSFIEIKLTYHKMGYFNMYNSVYT